MTYRRIPRKASNKKPFWELGLNPITMQKSPRVLSNDPDDNIAILPTLRRTKAVVNLTAFGTRNDVYSL